MADSSLAATAPVRFRIEPKPYSEALLDLAQQANITLVGARACDGASAPGLSGSYTFEQALDRLLTDAPCGWRLVAPRTVEITRRAPEPARAPPRPTTVSELLVTATKRARNPRQLAVAVSAVSGRDLEAAAAGDVADASPQLAGVLATNLGPGRNKLLLRGLSDGAFTGRTRSTVATYLDDLPINYNAPDPDLRLIDVERVEVARGPQGALYGSGALSGVYRIVTRKPDLFDYQGELRGGVAGTQGGEASHAVQGYANVPVWAGVAAVRLAAYQESQGGQLDDINLGRDDVDRTERRGGRLTFTVEPWSNLSLTVTGAGQHLRSDDTHYTTLTGLKRANRIPEPHVNDIALVTGTINGAWGRLRLTSSTGFVRHAYGSFYDATEVQETYTAFAQTSAYSERSRTRMFVQDTFVSYEGERVEWLAGLYGSTTSAFSPSELLAQNTVGGQRVDITVYSDERRDRLREYAAYGEGAWEIAPGWTVALGGRVFSHKTRTTSQVVSERWEARSFDRKREFYSFSPKLSVQRELASGDLLYAVVSEGHRPGGFNSGGARPIEPSALEVYSPDRLRHVELGAKLTFPEYRLALNTAVFYDAWRDIQTDQFRRSGIPFTTNAGDARILGLESELAFRWTENLSVQLNGRIARTRTRDANEDLVPQLADGLPGAPAVSGAAVVTYERPIAGDWLLRLTGEAAYVGRSRLSWEPANGREMGDYIRSRLVAELTHGRYGLQAYVNNPTNAYGDTFAFGNPFRRDPQVTPQRPRTFGLNLFVTY